MANTPEVISVIGLGKLGLPMAACFAAKGYRVIGVDTNAAVVDQVNRGQTSIYEPGLADLQQAQRTRLTATLDDQSAIQQSDITFIIVPTPSNEHDRFSLHQVLAACRSIGSALRLNQTYQLIVLASTVMPGSTEREVKATLEQYSGQRCGIDFGLCYSPEFFALGTVIRNLYQPDFILIGQSDSAAGDRLARFYRSLCENDPPIAQMTFVNAELAKLAVNTFINTKITMANLLAAICERLPGADIDAVTGVMGLDQRIGPKYLTGGLSFGGPCFPRDQRALISLAREVNAPGDVLEAIHTFNQQWADQLTRLVISHLPLLGRVGILGLAFKPDTDVIIESNGFELARTLSEAGWAVSAYDPIALPHARAELGDTIEYAASAAECLQRSDVIVIATRWPEFKQIQDQLTRLNRRCVIIDCWRLLDRSRLPAQVDYHALGVGPQPIELAKI